MVVVLVNGVEFNLFTITMARYTGPKTRINRRFNQAIFPTNKAFERKPYLPGQHGPRLRRKSNDYSIGLIEKQKLRFMYGLTEKQFRITFERAKAKRGITAHHLLQLLETRLDNLICILGLAPTRRAARQFVAHGHIKINGSKVDIPSYQIKVGDTIEVRERSSSRQLVNRSLEETQFRVPPSWLMLDEASLRATVSQLPDPETLETGVNVQLIVEFYSR